MMSQGGYAMRKSALAIVVVVAVLLGSAVSFAQDVLKLASGGPLEDLTLIGFVPAPNVQACGKYFRYTPSSDPKSGGMLLLVFRSDPRVTTTLPWYTDKFQYRVVVGTKVPMIKILRDGGPVFPWAEIVISPADREAAPCLDKVKVVGALGV